MQGGAKLKHELGALIGKRDEAQFIQDDELMATGGGNEALDLMLFLSQQQLIDQRSRIVKTHPPALSTSGQGKRRGDVRLSSAIEMTS